MAVEAETTAVAVYEMRASVAAKVANGCGDDQVEGQTDGQSARHLVPLHNGATL